jgi:hypothetical protein
LRTSEDVAARYEHSSHSYGFSPVWLRSCATMVQLCAARKGQKRQPYGFSPLCLRMWLFSMSLVLPRYSHSSHAKGRSPVCVRSCAARDVRQRKRIGQCAQPKGLTTTPLAVTAATSMLSSAATADARWCCTCARRSTFVPVL